MSLNGAITFAFYLDAKSFPDMNTIKNSDITC